MLRLAIIALLLFPLLAETPLTAADKKPKDGRAGSDWEQSEYGSNRSTKDLRTAYASKAFAWLSGSPADNEKLSIGKNAQFFGFVALRYESGRAANRGAIGRAFFPTTTDTQPQNSKSQAPFPETCREDGANSADNIWWLLGDSCQV